MTEIKTCFRRVDYDLDGLLHFLDLGDIGLPDIQRPFVWSNAKVRDLFDSMYNGFPVGYLLFWENGNGGGSRTIGIGQKAHTIPNRLIVDGQQRLTSLYAVFRGQKVLDSDYRERTIEIAFRPRDGRFDVCDAAIKKDLEWIPNISELWSSGKSIRKIVNEFLHRISSRSEITEDEEEVIAHNLDRLYDLNKYPFTALEISPSVSEEQVADIFVRINSEGVKLNQADFILTLLSVFWDEGRKDLETFCRQARRPPAKLDGPSPFNYHIQPDPDQLLRVDVALGFRRARLQSVYQILRGKDLKTGEFSANEREVQFEKLREAQSHVLDLGNWHQFLEAIIGAGFRTSDQISSQTALLYSYAYYLIGRVQYGLSHSQLKKLIGRWFYFATLTGRYSGSPESITDQDLNRVAKEDGDAYCRALDEIIASQLTGDYWQITVPSNLSTSSTRNPSMLAYVASQNKLKAPVLFSPLVTVPDVLDPALKAVKKSVERHHLFPRAYLERLGITDLKQINQVANFAFVAWEENIGISDAPPTEYAPKMREKFSPEQWKQMHEAHALPFGWESMEYSEFLDARRKLMADIIRRGFDTLA